MVGRVHSIESFATLDGGGIRFAVFMQGCPLRCSYCHNPDTQSVSCGRDMTARELVDKIKRNISFYRKGGVTISGGEPLLQSGFCIELTKLIHEECALEVAIDTSGGYLPQDVDELIGCADLFIVDLKFSSNEDYIKHTNVAMDNTRVLLSKLNAVGKPVLLRSVIIPTINDSISYMDSYLNLVKDYKNITRYELLGYHCLGVHKYENLNIKYKLIGIPPMDSQKLHNLQLYIDKKLIICDNV